VVLVTPLDEAMGSLGAKDRDAVFLRYFERKELRAVGDALGTNEEAARKRVGRALDTLRRHLTGRGVTLSAPRWPPPTGSAVLAAPAALAGKMSAAIFAGAATAVAGSTSNLLNLMSMTNLKTGSIALRSLSEPELRCDRIIGRQNHGGQLDHRGVEAPRRNKLGSS
jgi:hypothetical protein